MSIADSRLTIRCWRLYCEKAVTIILFSNCQPESDIPVPQDLGDLTLARVISAEKALAAINKLHGPTVTAKKIS